MRVVIAPDSFKGTVTAAEAAEALAEGWRRIRPQDTLRLLPLADGGEGTLAGALERARAEAAHWLREAGAGLAAGFGGSS